MHACSFYSLLVKMNRMDIHRIQFRQDVHQFLFIYDFIVYMYSICTINDLFMNHVSFVSRKRLLYESCIICIEKKKLLYESCIICIEEKDFYINHVSFVNVDVYDIAFI